MSAPVSIKEPEVKDDSFNLSALKEEGLEKLQRLSGNQWTDFNFHDPGVTLLEILCYALTDLSYRAGFDIKDLLNTEGKRKPSDTLFPPAQILSTAPVSILDFKRMILDIEGVKNCVIIPSETEEVVKGVYDIKIEIHPDFDDESTRYAISDQVGAIVQQYRPPGILFNKPLFLDHEPIGIILDAELGEDTNPKKIFTEFVQAAQTYFSPEIRFRGYQELVDKGVPVEEIFNGPLLENGFLSDEEISLHSIRKRVFVSDLIGLVMVIPGVSFVRELRIVGKDDQEFNWIYDVQEGMVPRIDPERTLFRCRYRNTVIFESKSQSVEIWSSARLNRTSSHKDKGPVPEKGNLRNLKKYFSIQNDFPETYGIGMKGPAAGASVEKLAAIKQFKGYLMIFDQVMANFLAQLDHIKYLFSTEDIDTSYAVQLVDEIPGIEYLYRQFIENYLVLHSDLKDKMKLREEWRRFLDANKEKLVSEIRNAGESRDEFLRRRNDVLEHLLARFGIENYKLELLSDMTRAEAIAYKLDLLRNFPKLSSEKYSTGPFSLNPAISGLKAWIAKNLNLRGANTDDISTLMSEKLYSDRSQSDFMIEVYTNSAPLNTLMRYGTDASNLVETGTDQVLIYDDNNEVVSRVFFKEQEASGLAEVVHRRLCEIDRASENFLLVDHITLKPAEDLPCYGLDVLINKSPFFCSERKYTLENCKKFLKEFSGNASSEEKFSIVETSMKEYRIRFKGSFGNLLSREYFSSKTEAQEKLEFFLDHTAREIPEHSFSTKYEDAYVNTYNPFSCIVTVLIPDWPSKFQKSGFRKYMEEFLCTELPAHLVVNIRWLDIERMKEVEKRLTEHKVSQESNDVLLRMNALDKLMKALIS